MFDRDHPDYLCPPPRATSAETAGRIESQCAVCGADHDNGIEICSRCELAYVKEMEQR